MRATKSGPTQAAKTQPKPTPEPCSCGGHGSSGGGPCTCCKPICFERPHYFCGQLLSDGDLSAEQRYFREKQKLYHRALHGHGVVCGLRLTCDPDCCRQIRIGEGYAIDDCGNDLVVCRSTSFDVITALEAKGYLVTEPPPDPCEDEKPPRCKVKRWFYMTIRYAEEEAEYTTPFKTDCGPGAAACEPTRIRETVRFDVLDAPPKAHNYLDELEKRITRCWSIFTDGQLGAALRTFHEARQGHGEKTDYYQLFGQLKVLFQRHLKKYPDPSDCTLSDQVDHLHCPTENREQFEGYQGCFSKLFELMVRYAYDCMLGEMIFECPCPPQAHCVGLGTIEVEDDKVLRVCNCPRTYVWSFANLVEVFLATFVSGAACASHSLEHESEEGTATGASGEESSRRKLHEIERPCCATFDFDFQLFLALSNARQDFGKLAASAPIHAIRRLSESLKTGFNFTDALAFSPEIFKGKSPEEAQKLADTLAGLVQVSSPVLDFVKETRHEMPDPITALLRHLLKRPGDPMFATTTEDGRGQEFIAETAAKLQVPGPPWQSQDLEKRVKDAMDKIRELEGKIAELSAKLNQPGGGGEPR